MANSKYFVLYAKVVDDEEEGLDMEYPFLGGESFNEDEADQIARRIIDENKNATIIPKILQADGPKEALERSQVFFYHIYMEMIETHKIMMRRFKN